MGRKISDVAKELNMTSYAIRYYDDLGLLTEVFRGEGGVRCFTQNDVDRLGAIQCLKNTGMSMKDIKAFMATYNEQESSIDVKREMILHQKQILEEKIAELEIYKDQSEFKLWFFDHVVIDGVEPPYSVENYQKWKQDYKAYKENKN